MNADNWTACPRCKEKAEQARADLLSRIGTDYGKIAATEYLKLVEWSRQPIEEDRTLREDYEIGIWNGELYISYNALCKECGFSYHFEHREKAEAI